MHPRHAGLLLCTAFFLSFGSALAVDPPKSASTKQYGPNTHESYNDEDHYDGLKHNCPTPQSADEVRQVYVAHGTFDWAAVAKQTAVGGDAAAKRKHTAEHEKRRPHMPNTHTPKPAAAVNRSSDTLVKPSAVTNREFKLSTSIDQTGVGFYGASDRYVSDEAIAVAEHPDDPDQVLIVHGINSVFEIFVATRDGKQVPSDIPTKIFTQSILDTLPITDILDSDPNLWYDAKAKRWVLVLTTFATQLAFPEDPAPAVRPPLVVAVSQTSNPLGIWTVWALDASVNIAPGLAFCSRADTPDFIADYPQATYSDDFVFITVGLYCGGDDNPEADIVTVLFAYSKAVLYALPPSSPTTAADIKAAVYLGPSAWYRSVPLEQQSIGASGGYTPFNNFIQPARPQDPEDMSAAPLFVMKVNNEYMSVAMLTDGEIVSVETAPKILARVFNKGGDFSNTPGLPEVEPSMLQPDTDVVLDAGDTGMVTLSLPPVTSGIRSYWAMQHRGTLYMTTTEYFGAGTRATRTPSIYWAILEPEFPGMCHLQRKDWGVIASTEGLATGYPVIAGTKTGAKLAYSYSGAGTISGGSYPAFPGVATTTVVCGDNDNHMGGEDAQPLIEIVQRGPGAIPATSPTGSTRTVQRWGDYSAAQVLNGQMWYVVPLPITNEQVGFWKGSWISVLDL